MIGVQWFQSRGPWFFPFSAWYGWTPPPGRCPGLMVHCPFGAFRNRWCSYIPILSAISAISAGHYYLMRIVFYCPDFYCPAEMKEIKEIKEIFIPLGEALSALSAISAGLLISHADSIYCPAEMKEMKEISIPLGAALSALSAISVGLLLSHADSIFIVPQSSALPLRSSKK